MRSAPRKTVATLFTFLLVTSLAPAADPPWKGKPYQQWDDKDIQRVFTDSPWTRITTVNRSWRPVSEKDDIVPNAPLSGAVRAAPTDSAHQTEASVGGELNVNILWASSRVMRAASARKSVLHGGQSVDVDAYAAQPQEEYQIVVQSADMAPFILHDERFFQEHSYLEVRKTKLKLAPSHVTYDKNGSRVTTAAIFFFPKKTSSGDPTIGPDEKNVEFNCKLENTHLRVNFEPQKMVDNQGPAL